MIAILYILLDGLWAALAAMGFAAVSNPPKIAFRYVALIAAIGHMLRFVLIKYLNYDIATSSLLASIVIGFMGTVVGLHVRMPNEVFSFPALLPMVPGSFGYKALLGIINFMRANSESVKMGYIPGIITNSITATLVMFALGVGVSIPLLLFQKKMDKSARNVFHPNE